VSDAHVPGGAIRSTPCVELIVVPRAEEGRPNRGRSSVGAGLVALIPFVPYARQEFTPEYMRWGTGLDYDFLRDVADAVIKDLQASGLATIVTADQGLPVGARNASHLLQLTVDEGIWHRTITAYGLSFAGVLVWMFAPASYGEAELTLSAVLTSPAGSSSRSGQLTGKVPIREWLWTTPTQPFLRRLPSAFTAVAPLLRGFVADSLMDACS
jgi:hypothetical protein